MEPVTDPCATSDSPRPAASPSAPTPPTLAPTPAPTPGVRIRTLAPLMTRENVSAIMAVSSTASITIRVTFDDGRQDSKVIKLAEGGSLALLLLTDNPHAIPGGAFYEIKP